ncbi:PCNA-interacting partner [Syngnathoides biaculeatus]|uniref:PCNA-interacting partner n=1 Tax=Syngnathoides biaculeatus TaxID=300417 RepID=UPI002ADD3F7D|nr:PCNA-interacting partner [Syngnathoides biaculeatus]
MRATGERLKQMVRIFRREGRRALESDRTTVHGADAMLMVLQLVLAEANKQEKGEFRADLSDVLLAWKHLVVDKLGLRPPDDNGEAARSERRDVILNAYEAFLKRSNAVDLVHVLLLYERLRDTSDPEEPVSRVELYEFLTGSTEVSAAPDPSAPLTPPAKVRSHGSHLRSAVRRVFCSYLSLLVNAKDDLALALTLDVPSRGLGPQTFTDIKHAARRCGMSLFLVVTSFVRAIQLGGKGYAPAPSDPLRKHVKGLLAFVHFLDSLEEILGETPDTSECGSKLVSAIRGALVKGCDSRDVSCAAEETASQLKDELCKLHQVQKETAAGTGISPARPKAYAVNHATAYGGRDAVKLLLALLDEEAATPPSANKADLLSEDQPALNGSEATSVLTLFRSPEISTGSSPEPLKKRVQTRFNLFRSKLEPRVIRSQFACTYLDEEEPPLNRILDFRSSSQAPTCVHPAPKPKTSPPASAETSELLLALAPKSGNANLVRAPGSGDAAKKRKRAGVERENESAEKKKRPVKASAGKKMKMKMIAGQATLTSFFRV